MLRNETAETAVAKHAYLSNEFFLVLPRRRYTDPAPPVPPTPTDDDWKNASQFLASRLRNSLLTRSCDKSLKPQSQALYTWQNGVVVNPSNGSEYESHLLQQLSFKFDRLGDAFQGLVNDRSDWGSLWRKSADFS